MLRSSLFVVALAFAIASPAPSHAQGSSVEDSDARALFNLGQAAFDQGRFQAAIDYFQQAYDLSHRPQLLFNIGQAADRLRDDRRALAAFEGFLAQVPESPMHSPTRARVEVLRASIASADAREAEALRAREAAEAARTTQASSETTGTTSSAATAPNDADGGGRSPAGWILAGGGAASLAVGATFLALGLHDKSTVENAADGSTYASVESAYDRASTRVTVGTILLGVGAAAGATGLALALRLGSSDDAEPTALELRVLPTGFLLRRVF